LGKEELDMRLVAGLFFTPDWLVAHDYDPEFCCVLHSGLVKMWPDNCDEDGWDGAVDTVGQLAPGMGVAVILLPTEDDPLHIVEVVGALSITDRLNALRTAWLISDTGSNEERLTLEKYRMFSATLLRG
jgi:hypothetical protein